MAPDLVREPVAEHVREVREQQPVAPGVIGEFAAQELVRQEVLRVHEEDGELRRRQPVAVGPAFRQLLVAGKVLDDAVDLIAELEPAQVPLMDVDQRRSLHGGVDQRLVLPDVVGEDELGDVVGHRRQQLVALLDGEVSCGHHRIEQDLDVDLVVGAVDPGGVVDGVGVDPTSGRANSIRARWVRPRLPPSPTTRQRSSAASTRRLSLALSPTSAWVSLEALT